MKVLKMTMALLILTTALMADEKAQTITMEDFDASMQGFSFSEGRLISVSPDDKSLPMAIDFIFDIPNGLGMNNGALGDWFKGNAMIYDLGLVDLDEQVDFSMDDYTPFLVPDEILEGHSYQIMTADAAHFGRIKILEYDYDTSHLSFEWINLN